MVANEKGANGEKTPPSEEFLQTREKLHRQMLSAVSHDLKTPLATIIGSLEVHGRMGDRLVPEKRKILLESALTEAYRLDNFITNILDMARLEGGAVTARTERCSLGQTINDCVIQRGPRRHRCDISVKATGDVGHAQTDPILLCRALSLVLENAMKHGGKHPIIEVEYGQNGQLFFVRIRDHGPGIPPGKEEAIFSKYMRFDRHDQQNAGTGLGLSICRRLMELLGGSVQVHNHPQGGAVFTLEFPG